MTHKKEQGVPTHIPIHRKERDREHVLSNDCWCNPTVEKVPGRMSRTPRPIRSTTIRKGYDPGPDCAVCGFKANNVRHERDPEHAPEGMDYYRPFLDELHEFEAKP